MRSTTPTFRPSTFRPAPSCRRSDSLPPLAGGGRRKGDALVTAPAAAPSIAPDARPRLPHGVRLVHNEAQGGWVLLAPERVFKTDQVAAEVVKRCTGEASFDAI